MTRPHLVKILSDQVTVQFIVGEFDFGVVKIRCPTPSHAEELSDLLRDADTQVDLEASP
jgi:hypothetical protein